MDANFYQTIAQLKQKRSPFSVATVISVRGSTSAKPGSKAIISQEGKNLVGWIGGGCAEKFICEQSLETLKTGQTKIVEADLDDEIFGLGMPCGGVMQVFIEPFLQPLEISLTCSPADYEKAAFLAPRFQMELGDSISTHLNSILSDFFQHCVENSTGFQRVFLEFAVRRSQHFFPSEALRSLKDTRGLGCFSDAGPNSDNKLNLKNSKLNKKPLSNVNLVLLGHSRISEEVAQLAGLLKWTISVYSNQFQTDLESGRITTTYADQVQLKSIDWNQPDFNFPQNSYVLVASHHKGDPEFIQAALKQNANYIGLVASAKRSKLVFEDLIQKGVLPEQLQTIHAPSGLDIHCITPAQIALSIISEMLVVQMQRTSDEMPWKP
jgi:xanthine/CO dehydrogenase XdhC/CoxF family maturation factor